MQTQTHLSFLYTSLLVLANSFLANGLPVNPTTSHVVTLPLYPRDARDTLNRRQISGTIIRELTDEGGYGANVTIDGQEFILLVDTGSPLTWVTSSDVHCVDPLTSDSCIITHHLNISGSELGGTFSVRYGSGNISGSIAEQPISIAGIDLQHQTIGVVDEASIQGATFDGILGLAPSPSFNTIFFNMLDQRVPLQEPSFSLVLPGPGGPNGKLDPGLLAFGGIPDGIELTSDWGSAAIVPDTPTPENPLYAIAVDEFKFPGSDGLSLGPSDTVVVVDSGTPITRLSSVVALALAEALPGSGSVTDKCPEDPGEDQKCTLPIGLWKVSCKGDVPPFAVVVGGMKFSISKENLVLHYADGCVSGVMAADPSAPRILGITFMNNVITRHSFGDSGPLLGFATYKINE